MKNNGENHRRSCIIALIFIITIYVCMRPQETVEEKAATEKEGQKTYMEAVRRTEPEAGAKREQESVREEISEEANRQETERE